MKIHIHSVKSLLTILKPFLFFHGKLQQSPALLTSTKDLSTVRVNATNNFEKD